MFAAPTPLLGPAGSARAAVVTGKAGTVFALDSAGNLLWQYRTPGRTVAPAAVGDVDGDAAPEVVVGDQTGTLSCLSRSGQLLWQARLPAEVLWAWPAIADLDGDGRGEVVIADSGGYLTCLRGTGEVLWRVQTGGSFGSGPAIGDINGDGSPEVVIGSGTRLLCLGADGAWLWEREFADNCEGAPVLVDLDGDRQVEILIGTSRVDSHLYALDGVTAEVEWRFNAGAGIDSSIAVADLNQDGSLEVIFGDDKAVLRCLTSRGEQIWSYLFEGAPGQGPRIPAAPVIGDVDGDGALEVVSSAHDGLEIMVFDANGSIEARRELPSGSNGSALLMPGQDGKVLIVATTYRAKRVMAFSAGGAWSEQAAPWPCMRLTSEMSGYLTPKAIARREFGGLVAVAQPLPLAPRPGAELQVGWNPVEVELPAAGPGRLVLADVKSPSGVHHRACLRLPEDQREALLSFEALYGGDYDLTVQAVRLPAQVEAVGQLRMSLVPFKAILDAADAILPRVGGLETAMAGRNAAVERALGREIALLNGFIAPLRKGVAEFNDLPLTAKLQRIAQSGYAKHELERMARLASLLEGLPAEETVRQVLAWPAANPWDQFDPEGLPAAAQVSQGLLFKCLGGEWESGALNLLNLGDEDVGVRVEVVAPKDAGVEPLPAGCLQVRQVVAVPTSTNSMSPDALEELGSASVVAIPAGRARQVWLTVRTQGLAPGTFRADLRLQPLTLVPETRTVPVEVYVSPVSLPTRMPVSLCTWSTADTGGPGRAHYVLPDLVAHYNDVFVGGPPVSVGYNAEGNLVGEIDWSPHDKYMNTYQGLGIMLLPGAMERLAYKGEGEPPADAWERAYAKWLPIWIAHMRENGWDYDTWAFYPVDEPGIRPGSAEELLQTARRVKAIDPRAQVYTDPVGEITMDELRQLAPYVDIWMPGLGVFMDAATKRGDVAEKIDFIRSLNRIMWAYSPVGMAKTQHPTKMYRMHFWQALLNGLTGVGFWTYYYETPDIDPWKGPTELSGKPASVEYAIVYASGDHMVASKRWEAVREGVEDCAYWYLLRDLLEECNQRGISGAEVESAGQFLESAPRTVVDSGMDDAVLVQVRLQMMAAVERLRSLLSG
jgi:outer membrane protein assembly factor BamB